MQMMSANRPRGLESRATGDDVDRMGRVPPAFVRSYAGVLTQPRTWSNFLYVVLAFPLGTAYFTVLVTFLAVGGGTAITLVGLPLLAATMFGWCFVAVFERWLANRLLSANVRPLDFDEAKGSSSWRRIRVRMANPDTWRSLAFLFARFPQGVVSLLIVASTLGVSLGLMGMPLIAQIGRDDSSGANLGIWDVDTWREGFLLFPVGLALLPLAFYVITGWAGVCGRMAELVLGHGEGTESDGASSHFDAAADAAAGWTGLSLQPGLAPAEHGLQRVQIKAFTIHFLVIAAIVGVIFFINVATTPGRWWFLWVLWPMSFGLAAHAGYLLYGWAGAHAGFFAIVVGGLFVIDAVYSSNVWFYWVALPWLAILLVHLSLDRRVRQAPRAPSALTVEGHVPVPVEGAQEEAAVGYRTADADVATGISVEIAMRRVIVEGALIDLTPKEFDLLVLLIQNPGRPFSRDELLDRVWRNDYEITDRTVDTHVQRLRKKLGSQADAIQTVWGVGYRYQG